MRSLVADLLADLADALEGLGVVWYLFGARAAILHGVARLTADVDVTLRLPESIQPVSLVTTLGRHGFQPRVTDADFITRTRVIPFIHMPTSLPLDLVLAGPGLEERFFERATGRVIEDVCLFRKRPVEVVRAQTRFDMGDRNPVVERCQRPQEGTLGVSLHNGRRPPLPPHHGIELLAAPHAELRKRAALPAERNVWRQVETGEDLSRHLVVLARVEPLHARP